MVVSRRSRYRAGLRYQRRGIDDDANVANFVETETIMRVEVISNPDFAFVSFNALVLDSALVLKIYSHMFSSEDQVRVFTAADSAALTICVVPLFWTQSGYGLKPPPLLASDRTHAQNLDVLKRHFQKTVPIYGPHVCFIRSIHNPGPNLHFPRRPF